MTERRQLATRCYDTANLIEALGDAMSGPEGERFHEAAEELREAGRLLEPTDWQAFAADMLSGDAERIKGHLPQWMQDAIKDAQPEPEDEHQHACKHIVLLGGDGHPHVGPHECECGETWFNDAEPPMDWVRPS